MEFKHIGNFIECMTLEGAWLVSIGRDTLKIYRKNGVEIETMLFFYFILEGGDCYVNDISVLNLKAFNYVVCIP